MKAAATAPEREALERLAGQVAIANAKLAYERYKAITAGPRWQALAARGAQPQRLLWASTGAKNPAYRDLRYVEELVGRETVNTIPPATLDAVRDHGVIRPSLEEDVDGARRTLAAVAAAGISLAWGIDQLAAVQGSQRIWPASASSLQDVVLN